MSTRKQKKIRINIKHIRMDIELHSKIRQDSYFMRKKISEILNNIVDGYFNKQEFGDFLPETQDEKRKNTKLIRIDIELYELIRKKAYLERKKISEVLNNIVSSHYRYRELEKRVFERLKV